MTDQIDPTSEAPANAAPRTWTDPVCTEHAVGDLTRFGGPGSFDGIQFS